MAPDDGGRRRGDGRHGPSLADLRTLPAAVDGRTNAGGASVRSRYDCTHHLYTRAPSRHHHCTIAAPSLHHRGTIAAPSRHHHCTRVKAAVVPQPSPPALCYVQICVKSSLSSSLNLGVCECLQAPVEQQPWVSFMQPPVAPSLIVLSL